MLRVLFLLTWFIIPSALFALSSDKQKDAYLEADSATLNYKTKINIYRGRVKLTQGTTVITADIITTYSNSHNQLEKAIATGQPASYSTLPDHSELHFTATAQTINYSPLTGQIQLIGQAKTTHGRNSFAGPQINYDIKQEIVTSSASPQGRTTIIIQPDQLQK